MDLWSVVRAVGAGVISSVVPGGSAIIGAVNAMLPDDQKLPETATGNDVQAAIHGMPPEQAAALKSKEYDLDITQIQESNATVRAMLDSDAKNPHTTRPYIAKQAFHVVAFTCVSIITLWAVAIATDNEKMVTAIMDGWQFILAVIGPLVTLLWAYFGILRQEHRQRMNAAAGAPTHAGITGLISVLTNR